MASGVSVNIDAPCRERNIPFQNDFFTEISEFPFSRQAISLTLWKGVFVSYTFSSATI